MKNVLKKNKIYHMDCINGLKQLKKQCMFVDAIVTSPPYNIGKKYNKYDDLKPKKDFLDWMEEIARYSYEIMNENASFFLNVGGKPSEIYFPFEIASRFRKKFFLQNIIHWIKSITIKREDVGKYQNISKDISAGHYKPINSKYYLNNCHEFIFHFSKLGKVALDKLAVGVPYQDKSNIKRWKKEKVDLRDRGNTWFIPYKTIRQSRKHPSTFPVKLPEMCLKLHGISKINLVLDPFMGIGSTAIACKKLKLDFLGFEIDETYIDTAKNRFEKSNI